MRSRGFRVSCAIRVLFLLATVLLFSYLVPRGQSATIAVCGVLILLQTYGLIRYVETTNRSLNVFLRSLESSDFTQHLPPGPGGKSFAELRDTLNTILDRLRELNLAREENLRYLHAIVQHIGIGVIAFRSDGGVELVNPAFKTLLDVAAVRTIEDLAAVSPELSRRLTSIGPGERDMLRMRINDELIHLSFYATELRLRTKALTLVSVQNVSLELNEKEMQAWRDLIRVLTHEIRNSLTPLASLAASVEHMVAAESSTEVALSPSDRSQAVQALQIIQKRSRGLLQFVDTYRDLTHLPPPEHRAIPVQDLFSRVEKLIEPRIEGKSVRFRSVMQSESMMLTADPQLIEQVLINLLLNALEATEARPEAEIIMNAHFTERSRPVIQVTDNGPGIVKDSLDKVFLPFYSTKKDGSGIGLSLSRQIMRMHRGDLTVQSEPGIATTFTLRF